MSLPFIHFVGIGLGLKKHLTFGAEEELRRSTMVYVMARKNSWMVSFVTDIVGPERVRTYMPRSVKWNCGWQNDEIFSKISDEVEDLVADENHVSFAMAGDVAIYGNVADSIIPIFRERGLIWDVFPGISFLNALTMLTGEPIVGESDNFIVTFAQTSKELDGAFTAANVVVLYNPSGFEGLADYISSRAITYARMIVNGVYGSNSKHIDLITDKNSEIKGIVILKRSDKTSQSLDKKHTDRTRILDFHIGANGWNRKFELFALSYPNRLMWSSSGDPENLRPLYTFPDNPNDVRGFFIDSKDYIYISVKGHKKGVFGRTYVSTDNGKSFEQVLGQSCWRFDEDRYGNIFAGVYHEKGEPNSSCSVFWTADSGRTWVDIASPQWIDQDHVHNIAVDPSTDWLYACLGDKINLRGCWRAKIASAIVSRFCPSGSTTIEIELTTKEKKLLVGDILYLANGFHAIIEYVSANHVKLREPLDRPVSQGMRILSVSWCQKIMDVENALQFTGIAFKNGSIFLANDTGPGQKSIRVVVFKVHDDGSDMPCVPTPVLQVGRNYGWGCFYLEMDRQGRLWAFLRPIKGKGGIWVSNDGDSWVLIEETPEEDLPCWRGTHTYRDGTLGSTGDGRNLTGPDSQAIVPLLSHSKLIIT